MNKDQNKVSDRWRTAVHEAGHAIAAAEAGVPINHVALEGWGLPSGLERVSATG